jgi:hypothetical protein
MNRMGLGMKRSWSHFKVLSRYFELSPHRPRYPSFISFSSHYSSSHIIRSKRTSAADTKSLYNLLINILKHTGNYMYHLHTRKNLYTLPTHCIYVFRIKCYTNFRLQRTTQSMSAGEFSQ